MVTPQEFENRIFDAGIIESKSHHELSQGLHGQKIDFGLTTPDSELWDDWVQVNVDTISNLYANAPPDYLMSVANGTNELVDVVADQFDGVTGLHTAKSSDNRLYLELDALEAIWSRSQAFGGVSGVSRYVQVVFLEDVSTTGSKVSQPIDQIKRQFPEVETEVVTTFQRRDSLEYLDERGVAYHAIIKRLLPTYTERECQEEGFCSENMPLIEYPKF